MDGPSEDKINEHALSTIMDARAYQNSAGILSLWHCIFAWYFAVYVNKDLEGGPEEDKTHTLIDIYRHMSHLRLATQGQNNPDCVSISDIAKPFNSILSLIPKDKLTGQLRSLIQEVATMRLALNNIKESLNVINIYKYRALNTTIFGVDDKQPKAIVSLLTLWYWLAAWSFPGQAENISAKDDFIQAIEAQDKMLGFLLVDSSPIHTKDQQELEILFSKLLQMLKSDPQYWVDILNRFTDIMSPTAEAPKPQVNSSFYITSFISWGPLLKPIKSLGPSLLDGIIGVVKDVAKDELEKAGKMVVGEVKGLAKDLGKSVIDLADKVIKH